jgi:curved DNA-binding protein CbpA
MAAAPLVPTVALFLFLCIINVLGSDPYTLLSVERIASQADIRRAYRKKALIYHPDKCVGEECSGMFEAIAEAYETLSDPQKKAIYDTSGDSDGKQDYSLSRSRRRGSGHMVFEEMFGDSSWRSWQEGDHITTQYIRNGKLIKLEIFPDGSSKESESEVMYDSSTAYSYSKKERNGVKQVHIQIDGMNFVEPLLIAFGASELVARTFGKIFGVLFSPMVLLIGIVYCCCWPRKSKTQDNPYRK